MKYSVYRYAVTTSDLKTIFLHSSKVGILNIPGDRLDAKIPEQAQYIKDYVEFMLKDHLDGKSILKIGAIPQP